MDEIWKDIEGYEGLYQVSNLGRVKFLERRVSSGNSASRVIREHIVTPSLKRGYHRIRLCKEGSKRFFFVHRLVADAFIPNIENKPTINHKDGIRNNNVVSNLEWATFHEQIVHSYNVLHRKKSMAHLGKFGKYHNRSKAVYQIINGDVIAEFGSIREATRVTNISSPRIGRCCFPNQLSGGEQQRVDWQML